MTDQDEESFAEWMFYSRKSQHRRRTTHTTHSSTNTQEDKK